MFLQRYSCGLYYYMASFAFLNFIDPRAATISVFGFTTMLHLYFGPMVVITILLIAKQWFDPKVIYILGGFTFVIQSAMFIFIPIAVDLLMGPSHLSSRCSKHGMGCTLRYIPVCLGRICICKIRFGQSSKFTGHCCITQRCNLLTIYPGLLSI